MKTEQDFRNTFTLSAFNTQTISCLLLASMESNGISFSALPHFSLCIYHSVPAGGIIRFSFQRSLGFLDILTAPHFRFETRVVRKEKTLEFVHNPMRKAKKPIFILD